MSYQLLRSLYFGRGANADITDVSDRQKVHVQTPLDELIPAFVRAGKDVVLTGNPGDGKSHLTKTLEDQGHLTGAVVELDLSAKKPEEVARQWAAAADARSPFVLCGNEGPLKDLLATLREAPALAARAGELQGQLGRLVCAERSDLPPEPRDAYLLDLADREVVDQRLITRCLARVSTYSFLPKVDAEPTQTSAGQNIAMFAQTPEARERFAAVLEVAGRHLESHVTFRQLWSAVAFALTGDKDERKLEGEARRDAVGLGTLPLDHLCELRAEGPLIDAVRTLADPGAVAVPELDEALWAKGAPRRGDWFFEGVLTPSPARRWADGHKEEAMALFKRLKRHVTLAHEEGARVLEALQSSEHFLPSNTNDRALLEASVRGLRALYLSPAQQRTAAAWLRDGVILWISQTYQDIPTSERPHVAVDALPASEFEVLRPHRAPWLDDALGPRPEVAWLRHRPSGIGLRLTASLLRALTTAAQSDGPMKAPEPVERFLGRLAGWIEQRRISPLGDDQFAIVDRPRGRLTAQAAVRELRNGGVEYASER